MGYNTVFSGSLTFVPELTSSQLAKVESFFGEDCRDHPEWDADDMTFIDLELTNDYAGMQWNGDEKTYDLVEKINLIIRHMRAVVPNFTVAGEMFAQGEEIGDIWKIVVDDETGYVKAGDIKISDDTDELQSRIDYLEEQVAAYEKALNKIVNESDRWTRAGLSEIADEVLYKYEQ